MTHNILKIFAGSCMVWKMYVQSVTPNIRRCLLSFWMSHAFIGTADERLHIYSVIFQTAILLLAMLLLPVCVIALLLRHTSSELVFN